MNGIGRAAYSNWIKIPAIITFNAESLSVILGQKLNLDSAVGHA